MDNSRQITKKIDWLDEQRRKDRKLIVELHEQLRAVLDANRELKVRIDSVEGELAQAREMIHSAEKVDDVVERNSRDLVTRLETMDAIRSKSEREGERLRQLEREAINKSLAELGEGVSVVGLLQEDMTARKDDNHRIRAETAEVRRLVEGVARSLEESQHLISNVHESRRLDSKRLTEFGAATDVLRKRIDEIKPKLESLQDASLRSDQRMTELTGLETERTLAQSAWMEQQVVTHTERERWWDELNSKSARIETVIQESSRKMNLFEETHREMQRALKSLDDNILGIQRRLDEAFEVQRVNHERLKDEWNTFLVEQEKIRADDRLIRDEEWREHNRKYEQQVVRLEALEEAEKSTAQLLVHLRSIDQERLKAVFSVMREFMSEYDQDMKKVP